MAADDATVIAGRYRLERKLGAGGMAEVWLATDQRLDDKYVAVKRLHALARAGDADIARARREAFAVARLDHPNLVAVTDFITEDGEPFIVMEYVPGTTLQQLCAPDGVPADRAARIVGQIASALSDAHDAGIVHRDIKPANVLVSARGDAKLADFGIARRADTPQTTTLQGLVPGTVGYLAPELFEGAAASAGSDIWALGATLYEALEGRPAYVADTDPATMYRILHAPAPVLRRATEFGTLLGQMFARDPADRPAAAEVAERVSARAADAKPLPRPMPVPSWTPRATSTGTARTPLPPRAPQTPAPPAPPPDGMPAPLPPPPFVLPGASDGSRTAAQPHRARWPWIAAAVVVLLAAGIVALTLQNAGGGSGASAASSAPAPSPTRTRPSLPPGAVAFDGVTVLHAKDLGHEPDMEADAPRRRPALSVDDIVPGHGASPKPTSIVTIRFTALSLYTGLQYATTWARGGQPVRLDLRTQYVGLVRGIAGYDATITPMRVGGRRIVIVPKDLAEPRSGAVRPNPPLAYVVDLVSIG